MTALDIVIFGGSGDLSFRKLMPALYFLYGRGRLPTNSRILALSRATFGQSDFQAQVLEKLKLFLGDDYKEDQAQNFLRLLDYRDLDIQEDQSWDKVKDYLSPIGKRDIIYYMAVPPTLFGPVCTQLSRTKLNPSNSRLVVEKPLGENEKTAEAVHQILSTSFRENQIYRIDHYLGKEAVQNILKFRFEEGQYEPLWTRDHIENIQITVAETVGVEGRAEFLDRVGILRDMIQNHLMQIMCFVAMNAPKDKTADAIRDQKVMVVKALSPITAANINKHVVRAQYSSGVVKGEICAGYLQEIEHKNRAGKGETFIALKALVDNDRWRGVPFYLRTGKRLSGRFARIVVQFKEGEDLQRIILNIQPDMTITVEPTLMTLTHDTEADNRRIPDAYEKLLGDVIDGNQAFFVRHDEIIASWHWIDGIRRAWSEAPLPLEDYVSGSMGPGASHTLLMASGHKWYED